MSECGVRAVVQADVVLLVGAAHSSPSLSEVEAECLYVPNPPSADEPASGRT